MPVQLAYGVNVVLPSRIATVYPVIGEPPSAGATQVMVTLVFEFTVVVGEVGTLGSAAALMTISDDSAPKPSKLRAATLNVYKTSGVSELAVYYVVVTKVASTEYVPPAGMQLIW